MFITYTVSVSTAKWLVRLLDAAHAEGYLDRYETVPGGGTGEDIEFRMFAIQRHYGDLLVACARDLARRERS